MSEPLVLVPGMMCDARLYAAQIADLSRDFAVMVVPVTGQDRVEDMAIQVLQQAPERFALAGLSMGGIVAMEVIRRAPERVTRIALIDTNALPETPQSAAAYEPLIVGAKSGQIERVMADFMRPEFLAPGPGRSQILGLVQEMARDLGAEVLIRQVRALQRRPDQQGTLRRIKAPALVLCGAHDRLTPVKRHEFMAGLIPHAQLQIIEEAGHLPVLETPGEINTALRLWMSQPYVLQ
ncbi:Pimeloyl-ACP methyl ester carboxylesterase [Salinihabitans flavidus]|uniref:Pimeloyl-ACP methyl ester carboxylesterase n=1 Tax=Salinihabitans flavidus TaxID=569882 RepID=A0A1H8R8J1_9RHOB|nr:alpha/beta hydrolase [Salinihabitans flavidus]SEO62899.1 Pimeloyl-ACP methyl ester carboxylesterase [Salinihabitans flavidus]